MAYQAKLNQLTPTQLTYIYTEPVFDSNTGTYPKATIAQPVSYSVDSNGYFNYYESSLDLNPSVSWSSPATSNTSQLTAFAPVITAVGGSNPIQSASIYEIDSNHTWTLFHTTGSQYSCTIDVDTVFLNTNKKGPHNFIVTAIDTQGNSKAASNIIFIGAPNTITSPSTYTFTRSANSVAYQPNIALTGLNGQNWSISASTGTITGSGLAAQIIDSFPASYTPIIREYTVYYEDRGYTINEVISVTVNANTPVPAFSLTGKNIVASSADINKTNFTVSPVATLDGMMPNSSEILFTVGQIGGTALPHLFSYEDPTTGQMVYDTTSPFTTKKPFTVKPISNTTKITGVGITANFTVPPLFSSSLTDTITITIP